MLCVTTVNYSFRVNDEVVGPIVPGWGLRQGDPLSPYLFILCAEGLLALIRREKRAGLIHVSVSVEIHPSLRTFCLRMIVCYFSELPSQSV